MYQNAFLRKTVNDERGAWGLRCSWGLQEEAGRGWSPSEQGLRACTLAPPP